MSKIALLLLGALLLSGAACQEKRYYEGAQQGVRIDDSRAPDATMRMDTVMVIDRNLQTEKQSRIAIERYGATSTPTGTMKVFVSIRNRTTYPQQLEARVQFFDSNQIPVEGPSAWERIYMDPQSIGSYVVNSARADVAHYIVEIQEAR